MILIGSVVLQVLVRECLVFSMKCQKKKRLESVNKAFKARCSLEILVIVSQAPCPLLHVEAEDFAL